MLRASQETDSSRSLHKKVVEPAAFEFGFSPQIAFRLCRLLANPRHL